MTANAPLDLINHLDLYLDHMCPSDELCVILFWRDRFLYLQCFFLRTLVRESKKVLNVLDMLPVQKSGVG
jgi:hypothetical protein